MREELRTFAGGFLMWVTAEGGPMPEWIPGAGVLALIGMLYLAKAAVIRHIPGVPAALFWYGPLLALAVPVTWAADHDWGQPNFHPVMNWLGGPVLVLTVPAASFVADLWCRGRNGRPRSTWWHVLEVVIALPAWAYLWVFFSFYALGWGWL